MSTTPVVSTAPLLSAEELKVAAPLLTTRM